MVEVRLANLDDTRAISALFRAPITVWQRLDARGRVETVDYESLTLYQRWLHGGAWMSVETGAVFLNELLLGAGIPLVALNDGEVAAYAEVYHGIEPEPFGAHLYLAHLVTNEAGAGLEDALLKEIAARAKALKCKQVLVSRAGDDSVAGGLSSYKLATLSCLRRYSVPARTGQVFYRAVESLDDDAKRIQGWGMPVGRFTSARHQWETLWPRTWDTLPEMRERKRHRLHFSAAGQEALICFQQSLYDPRTAEVYCWTAKGLTIQLLMSIRDWGHREGYRSLTLAIDEGVASTLGADAEGDGFRMETCALALS
jgi:hypothetical protein